jgi:photosystem II stability/assembly factor-like uncharacterized protein
MRTVILIVAAKIFVSHFLFAQRIVTQKIFPEEVSTRGLSAVDDRVAWVGGSKGWVGHTSDGGSTWKTLQVKGFETSDFRSVYAFGAERAIIANAGSPANILITKDAGQTWKVIYTDTHADAFIDGVDFWNDTEGLMYGDPIDGRMLLIKTTDGGG